MMCVNSLINNCTVNNYSFHLFITFNFLYYAVAEVEFEMQNYLMEQGEPSPICVTYDKALEKPIAVDYSMVDVATFG